MGLFRASLDLCLGCILSAFSSIRMKDIEEKEPFESQSTFGLLCLGQVCCHDVISDYVS